VETTSTASMVCVLAILASLARTVTLRHAPMTASDMVIASMVLVTVALDGLVTIARKRCAPMDALVTAIVLTPPVCASPPTLDLIVHC